jgi:hypothetical protein
MDDLEARFRTADRLDVRDMWSEIIQHEPRSAPPVPGPRRRILVATVALVLAAGSTLLVARAFLPNDTRSADATPTPSASPSAVVPVEVEAIVTDVVEVGPFPNAIAIGAGGAWVASTYDDGTGAGDIVRIDPRTAKIVARIPVEDVPGWEVGGGGIAIGRGSVWVLGDTRVNGTATLMVQRIDPSTNAVEDVFELGPGLGPGDVWVDETGIWAVGFGSAPNTLQVAHADADTGELLASFRVPGEWSQTIFSAGGSVWVPALVTGGGDAFYGPKGEAYLDRIDPATGSVEVAATVKYSWSFATPGGSPWLKVHEGIQRFDFATATLSGEPVPIPIGVSEPASSCCIGPFVADGAAGAWIANLRGPTETRGIWHVNDRGEIDRFARIDDAQTRFALGGVADGFDPATNSFWVVQYEDTVSRIEMRPS